MLIPLRYRDTAVLAHVFEMLDDNSGRFPTTRAMVEWLADQGTSWGDNLSDEEREQIEAEADEVVVAWMVSRLHRGSVRERAQIALGEVEAAELVEFTRTRMGSEAADAMSELMDTEAMPVRREAV